MLPGACDAISFRPSDVVPPLAAMSPSETTTGLRRATATACHMRSLARAEPPGDSMRSTTARTSGSSPQRRSVLMKGSLEVPVTLWLSPSLISPVTNAIARCARPS